MLVNHPVILKTQSLIKQKAIGKLFLLELNVDFIYQIGILGKTTENFTWLTSNKVVVLLDTSHEINYLQRFIWKSKKYSRIVGKFSNLEITSDDLALSILKFKNNIVGHVHLDLLQFEKSRSFKIIGTNGVIEGSLSTNTIKIFKNNKKKQLN